MKAEKKKDGKSSDVKTRKRFMVALSFPGEYRDVLIAPIASKLAERLGKDNIFYDNFYISELARPNLDLYLQNIYHNEAELVVIFLCKDYNQKNWCGIEYRSIRDLINRKNMDDRILFIKCGEGDVDGIFGTVDGYIDSEKFSTDEITNDILNRYFSIADKKYYCSESCRVDILNFTPKKLFRVLMGEEVSKSIIVTDNEICTGATIFYRNILPARLIEMSSKLWNSPSRVSHLLNGSGEKEYVRKMILPLVYENQFDVLVENCERLRKSERTIINNSFLMEYMDVMLSEIKEYDNWVEKKKSQLPPSTDTFSNKTLDSFYNHLKSLTENHKIDEILAMLIVFSFSYEIADRLSSDLRFKRWHGGKVVIPSIWSILPTYTDEELLISIYKSVFEKENDNIYPTDRLSYGKMFSELEKIFVENNQAIVLDSEEKREIESNSVVLIKGTFLLEDLYADGKHLTDFQKDVFSFLDIGMDKATFMFSLVKNDLISVKMNASGSKFNIGMNHLLQVIFESDRIFEFKMLGIFKKFNVNSYSLKPIIILDQYNHFGHKVSW